MLEPFRRKLVNITPPAAIVDNASYTTAVLDTVGYDYAVINVFFGATDIAVVNMRLQQSDESGANFADLSGSVYGTDNNDTGSASTLPSSTADNTFCSWFVDMRGKKRYLDVILTAGDGAAGTYATVWAELWRAEDAPRTAAQAGYGQRVVV
jgi:hypothetical protein